MKVSLFIVLFFFSLISNAAVDQPSPELSTVTVDPSSPRFAYASLVELSRVRDVKGSIEYFDFRHITDKAQQKEIVQKFHAIVNRKFIYGYETISPLPLGDRKDKLPFYRDQIIRFEGESSAFTVFFDRVKGPNGSRWQVSPLTIRQVDQYYSEMTNTFLGGISLPSFLFRHLFDLPIYTYLLFLLYGFLCFCFIYLLNPISPLSRLLLSDGKNPRVRKIARINKYFLPPLKLLVFSTSWFCLLLSLSLPSALFVHARTVFTSFVFLSLIWGLSRAVDFVASSLEQGTLPLGKNKPQAPLLGGKVGVKVVLYFILVLLLLQNWGINVTAIFASLGVGGIAIALAGQKTFENLFGGVMLAADKPVRVGDFCKFGDYLGTVEEIGPRSTKVRTTNRTVVVVPNGDFSQMQIENFHRRDKIRLHNIINLTYSTSPDQVRYVLVEIKKMLVSHPMVESEGARVRFVALGSHSLDIEIYTLIETAEWSDYLAVKEDILLRLMDIVKEAGTSFAFPTQTLHLTREIDEGASRRDEINSVVQNWKSEGQLNLPEMPEEKVAELNNTTVWPDSTSALYHLKNNERPPE